MTKDRTKTKVMKALSLDDYSYDIIKGRFVNVSKMIDDNQYLFEKYKTEGFGKVFQGNIHLTSTTIYPEITDKFKSMRLNNFSKFVRFCVHELYGVKQ